MPNSPVDVAATPAAPHPQTYAVGTGTLAGTVTDSVTDLMWQQTPSSGGASFPTFTWANAAAYCTSISLGGYTDWRLPTLIELASLADYDVAFPGPTINATAFPSTPGNTFWSATPYAGASGAARGFNFGGDVGATSGSTTVSTYVRCVR